MLCKAKVNIFGPMEDNIKVNGLKIKCMDKESLHGQMAELMRETMKMTSKVGMENSNGLMELSIKDNG